MELLSQLKVAGKSIHRPTLFLLKMKIKAQKHQNIATGAWKQNVAIVVFSYSEQHSTAYY